MRSHSYLNSAVFILSSYEGNMPLATWLKQYFAANKKFGSKNRKEIAHVCYCFYRAGAALGGTMEERMLLSLFLCADRSNFILQELRPEWNALVAQPLEEKLALFPGAISLEKIFPFTESLSPEIDPLPFIRSHLVQPYLFLRCRPGRQPQVLQKLEQAGIPFYPTGSDSIAVANGTRIETVLQVNREVVVQDLNSQKVLEPLVGILAPEQAFEAWDCCAASGGKTMLLKDRFPSVKITVSDIRNSILVNLQQRLREAGINHYDHFVADLAAPEFKSRGHYDLVLCDAPCSGSGTWGRTPEQLYFFTRDKIGYYTDLQKRISLKAAASVKKGGYFLYCTCSVFREENEAIVAHLLGQTALRHMGSFYFKGYNQKADTLFAALFQL